MLRRQDGSGGIRGASLMFHHGNGLFRTPAYRLDCGIRSRNRRFCLIGNFLHGLLAGTAPSGFGGSFLRWNLFHGFYGTPANRGLLFRNLPFTFVFRVRRFFPDSPLAWGGGRFLCGCGRVRVRQGFRRNLRRGFGPAHGAFFDCRLRRTLLRSQIWGSIRHEKEG